VNARPSTRAREQNTKTQGLKKMTVKTLKVEQFKPELEKGKTQVKCTIDGHSVIFTFAKVKTGFGHRNYLICPNCGKNCVQLAYNGRIFACFKCIGVNPYEGIQKTTRGGDDFIAYKMERYAQKRGVESFHYPFYYWDYERPKRRNVKQWDTTMLILQALESMRNQSIFLGKIWSAATIRSVEKGTNPYLQLPAIHHAKYWCPFDGKPLNAPWFLRDKY
jgi:hypothetical protein